MDHELERLEEEKSKAAQIAEEIRLAMAEGMQKLERRMQQQQEAHERESDEHHTEKRWVKFLEAYSNAEGWTVNTGLGVELLRGLLQRGHGLFADENSSGFALPNAQVSHEGC